MSQEFRELLKKIGSGVHTGKNLSRQESATATRLILEQEATPAQIGAYLIAHRIKRPTAEEMAGILDAYEQLGPQVATIDSPHSVIVFGTPYDGRARTAPVLPLTALILATLGVPVLMHGGDRTPTKYGVPLVELWQGLGVDWMGLSLPQVHQMLSQTSLGFVYLRDHFPLAQGLVTYRDQIGKRPPLATAELFWCPYAGDRHLISGFVHPPTETLLGKVLALRGTNHAYTTIKGLEGSCDLARDRTAIIGSYRHDRDPSFQRLTLSARTYNVGGADLSYGDTETVLHQMHQVLQGEPTPLLPAVLWNGGFYLWQTGLCETLEAGMHTTESLLQKGTVFAQLQALRQTLQGLKSKN